MKTLVPILALGLIGCAPSSPLKPSSHSNPPATVMQISKETELASVRLTPEAESRLGISLVSVKSQPINCRRPYPGIVVVPPQNLTTLTAPITGTVRYLSTLAVGSRVAQGQPLFSFTPVLVDNYALGPSQQMSLRATQLSLQQSEDAIKTRINNARVEVEASQIDLRRAEKLYQEQVGSRKRVDDARARWQLAQEVLDSARRELQTVTEVTRQPVATPVIPMSQNAPLSGTISRITVSDGQAVTAGQPLLELMNLNEVWLRVRIPQAEASEIEGGKPAVLTSGGRSLQAEPVRGAPTGDQLTSSLDLYFSIQGAGLNPDQRIQVSLPLRGTGVHLVVPTASVLYDIYGGSWVYVRKQPHQFERQRVLVDFTTEQGQAVLSKGPSVGVTIVQHGAAELFGIEFGND